MFGSFLPSLRSLSNHSLLGSRSRHCYAIKWIFSSDATLAHASCQFTDRPLMKKTFQRPPHASARIPVEAAPTNSLFAASDWGRFSPPDTSVFGMRVYYWPAIQFGGLQGVINLAPASVNQVANFRTLCLNVLTAMINRPQCARVPTTR